MGGDGNRARPAEWQRAPLLELLVHPIRGRLLVEVLEAVDVAEQILGLVPLVQRCESRLDEVPHCRGRHRYGGHWGRRGVLALLARGLQARDAADPIVAPAARRHTVVDQLRERLHAGPALHCTLRPVQRDVRHRVASVVAPVSEVRFHVAVTRVGHDHVHLAVGNDRGAIAVRRVADDDALHPLVLQILRQLSGVLPGHAVGLQPAAIHDAGLPGRRRAVRNQLGPAASAPALQGAVRGRRGPLGLRDPLGDLRRLPPVELAHPIEQLVHSSAIVVLRAGAGVGHFRNAPTVAPALREAADDLPVHEQGLAEEARELAEADEIPHRTALPHALLVACDDFLVRHAFPGRPEGELLSPELELAVGAHVVLEVVSHAHRLGVVLPHHALGHALLGRALSKRGLGHNVRPRLYAALRVNPKGCRHVRRQAVELLLRQFRCPTHLIDVAVA
mmetsp:Transcript_65155/g.199273  ORF Transcript_65155/g.199273 Transcript_65155/m.199273 type:complete len:448 (-) Transcript_65155:318-1661(-)